MHSLIREFFAPAFELRTLNDSAVLDGVPAGRLALTTDSYVVSPYFFPGGDIGVLSVCGTVNDLSMAGARPLWLTAGFIIEEGLPVADLRRLLESMQRTAREIGVRVVAGDTKVVERGKGDGIYINTAGVGVVEEGVELSPARVRPGDKVILSGPIGNHGMAVMAERNGITFDPPLLSDVRSLHRLAGLMMERTKGIRVMRDPTRGGLATTLKEIALEGGCCVTVEEERIPIPSAVIGACELLGLDPLFVANEGILVAVVDPEEAVDLAAAMRTLSEGAKAAVIGEVSSSPVGTVLLKTEVGGIRILDMLSGGQLPRIC